MELSNVFARMMVCAVVLVAVLSAAGCSEGSPASTGKNDMRTVCLDGVTYYLFKEHAGYTGWGYMSVKLGTDSKVILCDQ